jgi:hypothetical protein
MPWIRGWLYTGLVLASRHTQPAGTHMIMAITVLFRQRTQQSSNLRRHISQSQPRVAWRLTCSMETPPPALWWGREWAYWSLPDAAASCDANHPAHRRDTHAHHFANSHAHRLPVSYKGIYRVCRDAGTCFCGWAESFPPAGAPGPLLLASLVAAALAAGEDTSSSSIFRRLLSSWRDSIFSFMLSFNPALCCATQSGCDISWPRRQSLCLSNPTIHKISPKPKLTKGH